MGKQKTTFVWILIGLITVWLIFGASNIMNWLTNFQESFKSYIFLGVIGILFAVIAWVLALVLWYKLYNVASDVQKWVNYYFGFAVFQSVLSLIITFVIGGVALYALPTQIIILLIQLSMWKGISMHLARAKRENLMDFS